MGINKKDEFVNINIGVNKKRGKYKKDVNREPKNSKKYVGEKKKVQEWEKPRG